MSVRFQSCWQWHLQDRALPYLTRLRRGGQAKLSAALGAHCLDKPGGLVAQLKLGQRGLASSLRCWEIPCVLQRGWPLRGASGGGGGWRWGPRPPRVGAAGWHIKEGDGEWGGKVKGNEAVHELLPAWGFIRKAKALNYWPCVVARSTCSLFRCKNSKNSTAFHTLTHQEELALWRQLWFENVHICDTRKRFR